MNNIQSLIKLYPQIVKTIDDKAFDEDGNEVSYDLEAVQAHIDSNEYQLKRAAEYPSIQEQLDTLYHGGLTEWKATIKAVKDKYPKE